MMLECNEKVSINDRRLQVCSDGWRGIYFDFDHQLLCLMRAQPELVQQPREMHESRVHSSSFTWMNCDIGPRLGQIRFDSIQELVEIVRFGLF